ncbi:hypothetical protein [Pelomonas sp. Root1237]|uniref:hypothetical protein n=1 Tax=Pelomonas sp. Root1237 TaxID=1736434 RepID=UPI0006FF23FE|nr:hypothetical protein [Pelomonas sp. Root1237]KQV88439.1 hypothetical protein ASC91_16740 [Pelomonas sp. Root1237]
MPLIAARPALAAAAVLLMAGAAQSVPDARSLASDPAAVQQLVEAVSLDVMSEATLGACEDMGVASAAPMRDAWVAWRERHQLAPLRMVVARMQQRSSSIPSFTRLTEPMRQRVLDDPSPEQACAALARDWQSPAMDVSTLYPQARAVALALVKANLVAPPSPLAIAPEAARGQFLLPSQIPALTAQRGHWLVISEEEAQRKLGVIYVKGRVAREIDRPTHFFLVQQQGDRHVEQRIHLKFDAEPWVGREVVLRGVVTSLNDNSLDLADAALVANPAGLTSSPLPQAPMLRRRAVLQRVTTLPGRGLAEKDLAAVVIHGESNFNGGTRWEEDVRFLLRDGTVYHRTEMPPDQLNVAASRQLEPQRWGRWRASGKVDVSPQGRAVPGPPPEGVKGTWGGPTCPCEMQPQDDDGRPAGAWQAEKHHAVRPWPKDTRLEGSFTRGTFTGSLVLGGRSSSTTLRFMRDGRFERSYSALSSTGTLAATLNNTVIAGSAHGDGKGSSSTGGGTVGTPFGTAGAVSSRKQDDGAGRRGRYQLSGFVLTLDYDDGHQERLLSFPVHDDNKTVYMGSGSLVLDK